ncbi:hypothetical protein E1281_15080 [Actinomadura sp. KC345]|nr:hypothetical protein E1281_15080 [Actinomadura sp. KC345]
MGGSGGSGVGVSSVGECDGDGRGVGGGEAAWRGSRRLGGRSSPSESPIPMTSVDAAATVAAIPASASHGRVDPRDGRSSSLCQMSVSSSSVMTGSSPGRG